MPGMIIQRRLLNFRDCSLLRLRRGSAHLLISSAEQFDDGQPVRAGGLGRG